MITVTKEFWFEAAHRLMEHPGACKNLHGHSYKLVVTVAGKQNKQGMVVDFHLLTDAVKSILNEGILKDKLIVPFDHSVMLYEHDPLVEQFRDFSQRIVQTTKHPTAEYLSVLFADLIDEQLNYLIQTNHEAIKELGGDVPEEPTPFVCRVEVWETKKAFAVFEVEYE